MQISEVRHEGDVPGLWVRSPLGNDCEPMKKENQFADMFLQNLENLFQELSSQSPPFQQFCF